MTKLKPNILTSIALLLMGWVAVSCSSESMPQPEKPTGGVSTLSISIGVSGPSARSDASSDGNGGFETGVGLENYLDIANNDYRIYFFDKDNKYLATFNPVGKPSMATDPTTVNGVDTYYYDFWGVVPKELEGLEFKLVFLANWTTYPEESDNASVGEYKLVKGQTEIADLTTNAAAQFSHLSAPGENAPWLSKSDRLIPFYGVRYYNLKDHVDGSNIVDGKIKGGIRIDLSKNNKNKDTALPIIRAMAKVEVILANPLASFSKVEMTRVNDKGFCAPYQNSESWKYDYTDYFHGYIWDTDFVQGVHLVNGVNGVATENGGRLSFKKVSDHSVGEDGKPIYEKWVAYVPEYHNQGATDFTAIEVTLAEPQDDEPSTTPDDSSGDKEEGSETTSKPWDNPTNKIYFAQNGNKPLNADKEIDNTNFFNIERNNIYRFTINDISFSAKFVIDVIPYSSVILEPEFGLDRDENGNIIYPSSK